MIRVERHKLGPRLHFWGWRCHHYHIGLVLLAVGVRLLWRDRLDLMDALLLRSS